MSNVINVNRLRQHFESTQRQYGPVTFWSWNDDLQEDELVRQIRLMNEAGWAGFFMHARGGLETPYLSNRWFDCVKTCVNEAQRLGMQAWIYDEDQWPSGFAGGLVSAQNPEFRAKALWCVVDDKPTHIAERLGTWIARRQDGRLVDFQPAPDPKDFDPSTYAWVQIHPVTASMNQARHRGYCYADVLNPDAVRAFIESTYEAYAREIGESFGTTVTGVFTDEPQYLRWDWYQGMGLQNWHQGIGAQILPWTGDLLQAFKQTYDYDLVPELPCLFFDTGDFPRVRYHFWKLVTLRFVESYTKQIHDWCHQHNLIFTGHYLREDSLDDQMRGTGAVMPHYEYFDYPAIDKLGRHIDQPMTVKQVDSVACQLGKTRTVCEAYGCAGQDFSFAGRKWIGDHLFALGINLLNPHLSLYSMRGERKRDFPPNLFHQQPWWRFNRQFDDYFTRLSFLLSRGQRVVDVVVLHPMASAWTAYRPSAPHQALRLSQELRRLTDTLLAVHRDYHFADEMLLERYGSVNGDTLCVGKMSYQIVVVPPSITLSQTTVDLLHKYVEQGGKVVSVGSQPYLVDGRPSESVLPAQVTQVANERSEIAAALSACLAPDVSISGEGAEDIIYHHRRDGCMDQFFIVNQNLSSERQAFVRLPGSGRVEEWNAFTGVTKPVGCQISTGSCRVQVNLPAAGSCLLVMGLDAVGITDQPDNGRREVLEQIQLPDEWRFERKDPNVLTLDTCRLSLEGGPWFPAQPIWRAHREAAQAGAGTPFKLLYEFDVEELPTTLELVVEQPWQYQIDVNGRSVDERSSGFFRDISFKRMDITQETKKGLNQIGLMGIVGDPFEMEAIYLIGDFGVSATRVGPEKHDVNGMDFDRYSPGFRIACESGLGRSESLNEQGYPFFAGTLSLRQVIDVRLPDNASAFLRLEQLHAAAAEIYLNGQSSGAVLVPPHEIEVTELIRPGINEIEIHLVSSLRNMLGPLHRAGGDPERIWPHDFTDVGGQWTDDYIFVPFGFGRAHLCFSRADGIEEE